MYRGTATASRLARRTRTGCTTSATAASDDPSVPIVMFASGTGLAPMRGFIQERAAQKESGRAVGRALLFYGCRAPGLDFLYGEAELKAWQDAGVVEVRPAFSRDPAHSEGCKYVQEYVVRCLFHPRQS